MCARSSDQRLLFWPACVQGWACEGLGTWAGLWVNFGFRIVTQHVLWAAMDGSKKGEFVIFGFSFPPRAPNSMLRIRVCTGANFCREKGEIERTLFGATLNLGVRGCAFQ